MSTVPRRHPAHQTHVPVGGKKRVAIIGAGWNGLQTGRDLLARGGDEVEVTFFEKLDDVGGTWHDSRRTAGMKLHAPLFVARFDGLQYDNGNPETQARRLGGHEVQEYNRQFADHHSLRERVRFCRTVIAIDYDSVTTQVAVTHVKSDSRGAAGPIRQETRDECETQVFDFVLFAAQCGDLRMPSKLTGQDTFQGKFCHSARFQDSFIQDILAHPEAEVAVIGASKSAVDVITSLEAATLEHAATTAADAAQEEPRAPKVAWVYSQMYWFLNYERIIGEARTTLSLKFDAAWFLVCLMLARYVGGAWALWLLRLRNLAEMPEKDAQFRHYDASKCHLGMLDESQFAACHRTTNRIREASVTGFYADGLVLEDGRQVPCTHAVFATGYLTGFDNIVLNIDGQPAPPNQGAESYFYLEQMPTVGTGVLAQFSFGAMRATLYADLILQRIGSKGTGVPSFAERRAVIDRQHVKTTLGTHLGFSSSSKGRETHDKQVGDCPQDIFASFVALNLDWVAQGIFTLRAFLVHWWNMFVVQIQMPMESRLLYKQ